MDKDLLEAIALLQNEARRSGMDLCLVGALASEAAAREAGLPSFRAT